MPLRLRVFISSPGDVPDERLRADLVIDKLSQDYARFFKLESYRWEHEPMLASGHFQDAVEPPSKFDIVIMILWSRLGTALPPRTNVREYRGLDGRVPVTGTEWEYEEALKGAREHGAPDILAFRNVNGALIDTRDPDARAKGIAQLDALDAFWRRHFADRGVFLAAYDEYHSLEEFAHRLEQSLRALLDRKVRALAAAPPEEALWIGPPFRGLQAFEFEHAAIFYGRDALVAKAAEHLASRAREGCAFLLVSGASGSGKSSLVKAALVPGLMKRQRIQGAAFLRRATFRPADADGDLMRGLVEALTRKSQDENVGLPELLAPGRDPAQLAAHLRAAGDQPGFVFAAALGHLTSAARHAGRLLAFEEAKLILVIDQLEELFTLPAVAAEERRLFVRLLAGLARSGAVWAVATLRADFWHRAAELPELVALAEGSGRLDVSAPSRAEIGDMIRKPAQAAGLSFAVHPETGLSLDSILAEDAGAEPGTLPLLSFTLDEIYRRDVTGAGGHVLTYATYEALGGLEGAIATRADEVIAALPAPAQTALPRMLRALVTAAEEGAVARTAPLDSFAPGSDERAVVDALTAARLLVAAREGTTATVRLAHEALISRWTQARDQLARDRRDLETRALVERQRLRWQQAAAPHRRQLLLRDPDLASAVDLAKRWGHELDAPTRTFIDASRRRARLRQQLTLAAAVLFAIVAAAAVLGQQQAIVQRSRAENALRVATDAANTLVDDLAKKLRDRRGMPVDLVRDLLDRAQRLQQQLMSAGETAPELRFSAAKALNELVLTLLEQGAAAAQADTAAALNAAERYQAIMAELVAGNPGNVEWQYQLSLSHNRIGDVLDLMGRYKDALDQYNRALAIRQHLAELDPREIRWQEDLATSYSKAGDELRKLGRRADALDAYDKALAIRQKIAGGDPGDARWPQWQRDLAVSYERKGIALDQMGAIEGALDAFTRSLEIRQKLAAKDESTVFSRDLSVSYELVGYALAKMGKTEQALAAYQTSFAIRHKLAQADPGNGTWQRDLAVAYGRIGETMLTLDRRDHALEAFRSGLAILEQLVENDPGNVLWQTNLVIALRRLAQAGDEPRSRLMRALEITRRLEAEGKLGAEQARWIEDLENKLKDLPPQ
jgi:tetratricopeptide (TPR) repeat protein